MDCCTNRSIVAYQRAVSMGVCQHSRLLYQQEYSNVLDCCIIGVQYRSRLLYQLGYSNVNLLYQQQYGNIVACCINQSMVTDQIVVLIGMVMQELAVSIGICQNRLFLLLNYQGVRDCQTPTIWSAQGVLHCLPLAGSYHQGQGARLNQLGLPLCCSP